MDIEKIRLDRDSLNQMNHLLDIIRIQLINSIILVEVAQAKPETPVDLNSLKETIRSFGVTFVVLENKRDKLVKAIENYQSQVDELKKAYADLKQDNYELKGLVPLSFHRKELPK